MRKLTCTLKLLAEPLKDIQFTCILFLKYLAAEALKQPHFTIFVYFIVWEQSWIQSLQFHLMNVINVFVSCLFDSSEAFVEHYLWLHFPLNIWRTDKSFGASSLWEETDTYIMPSISVTLALCITLGYSSQHILIHARCYKFKMI